MYTGVTIVRWWRKKKVDVDRDSCTCSCWDAVFKGFIHVDHLLFFSTPFVIRLCNFDVCIKIPILCQVKFVTKNSNIMSGQVC